MADIDITPIAYKYRIVKDGIVSEFVALKDINVEEAKKKIEDFLSYFRPTSLRRDIVPSEKNEKNEKVQEGKDRYCIRSDRERYLLEFAESHNEFARKDYYAFMVSKGLKFKRLGAVSDDLMHYRERGIVERVSKGNWKFIVDVNEIKEKIRIDENVQGENAHTQGENAHSDDSTYPKIKSAKIPSAKQRRWAILHDMSSVFTVQDIGDHFAEHGHDRRQIIDNACNDIKVLLENKKIECIGGMPKKYKIIDTTPLAREDKVIESLKNGHKVLMGTIAD